MNWAVSRGSNICTVLDIKYNQQPEWEQWGLITADRHLDNPASDRDLQVFHLDQAKERGAFVLDFGDLFDAMQGKGDKRASKKDLLPELLPRDEDEDADDPGYLHSKSYYGRLAEYVTEFLKPYSQNLALISEGNHETGVNNKIDFHPMDSLMYNLHNLGCSAIRGGYRGWIRFQFEHEAGGKRTGRTGYYIHGYGGGGQVTKDIIQANRKAAYIDGADYVFTGHTHDSWVFPIERTKLLESYREVSRRQYHVKCPSYKDEFFNKSGGWHHERGGAPKPTGAWWMRFYWSARSKEIKCQFIEADS